MGRPITKWMDRRVTERMVHCVPFGECTLRKKVRATRNSRLRASDSVDDHSTVRDDGQAVQEVLPSVLVIADRVLGQTTVDQSHERFVTVGYQSDRYLGGSGGNRVARFVPTEGEDKLLVHDDFHELT